MAYRVYNIPYIESQSHADIRRFFERQKDILFKGKYKLSDDIRDWEVETHRKIQEHAANQRALLESRYEDQVRDLDNKAREFLETLLVYEQRNNLEQIRKLVDQCRSLKFILVTLEYPEESIPFIYAKKMTEPNETKQEQRNPRQNGDNPSIVQTNQSSVVSKPTNTIDHSMSGINRQSSQGMSGDGSDTKCPICFMIFAPTLESRDRTKHVNEHYA